MRCELESYLISSACYLLAIKFTEIKSLLAWRRFDVWEYHSIVYYNVKRLRSGTFFPCIPILIYCFPFWIRIHNLLVLLYPHRIAHFIHIVHVVFGLSIYPAYYTGTICGWHGQIFITFTTVRTWSWAVKSIQINRDTSYGLLETGCNSTVGTMQGGGSGWTAWIFDSYITTYNCPACKFIPTLRSSRNTDRLFHLIFPCSFRISCSWPPKSTSNSEVPDCA